MSKQWCQRQQTSPHAPLQRRDQ